MYRWFFTQAFSLFLPPSFSFCIHLVFITLLYAQIYEYYNFPGTFVRVKDILTGFQLNNIFLYGNTNYELYV